MKKKGKATKQERASTGQLAHKGESDGKSFPFLALKRMMERTDGPEIKPPRAPVMPEDVTPPTKETDTPTDTNKGDS